MSACEAIDSCEYPNMQCSQVGTCLPKGQAGTFEKGESCEAASECAFGLDCSDQVCIDGGE